MNFRKRTLSAIAAAGLALSAGGASADTPSNFAKVEEVTLASGKVMIYQKNVPIKTRDGTVVYANVYRPKEPGKYPVIMAQGPYGKDVTFESAYAPVWATLRKSQPNLCAKSSCRFIRWEETDPERWVGDGYVIIAVDVRGAGYSPGKLDIMSPKENEDYYDAIEWAGTEPWSNGKVGLLGISYMAINQWQVAGLRPPHLTAIAPWEGASDIYREVFFQAGIFDNVFMNSWYKKQVISNQNGNATTTYRDPDFGTPPTGNPLDVATLAANRYEPAAKAKDHPLLDGYWRALNPKLENITAAVLSAGNLSAAGLHGRGNYQGYKLAATNNKWLMLHTGTHDDSFYSDAGVELQHRYFDHFLKGVDNGWEKTAPVTMTVRDDKAKPWADRTENEWPLKRTTYRDFYLAATPGTLSTAAPGAMTSVAFDAGKTKASFAMTFDKDTEITGQMAAKLWISSSTTDADLFVTLQVFDDSGKELTFLGASDPASPFAQGWVRASLRHPDPRSTPSQPWLSLDRVEKLKPGTIYPVNVEIWPTSIVVHKGYKLVMTVAGSDFIRPDPNDPTVTLNRGSGSFLHTDPTNRPMPEFAGKTTVVTGGKYISYLKLPIIPPK